MDKLKIHYYFQYTLNDYQEEQLEPGVPNLEYRIKTFKRLSELLGSERVIWRFDPLILGYKLTLSHLLEKISQVGNAIYPYTQKLIFSFVDINAYYKVRKNLQRNNSVGNYREFTQEEKLEFARNISIINKFWRFELATCAEDIDLAYFRISRSKCIDPSLLGKIFSSDVRLMDFLQQVQHKDSGQRKDCGCLVSKDIGEYNTCMHLCEYCYAKHTKVKVYENYKRHNEFGEKIVST